VRAASSGSPVMVKAPTCSVVLGEALGVVGLARGTMNRCGGDRVMLGFCEASKLSKSLARRLYLWVFPVPYMRSKEYDSILSPIWFKLDSIGRI
jgi:hypothetical protein